MRRAGIPLAFHGWRMEVIMARLRLLLPVIVAFTAVAAYAQASFVVERIDVNPGIRAAIIRAETRLVTGRSYTTEDVEQAVYRVRRLPFVTDAGYTLIPGSSPSSRVVQINVIDQHPFNYDADLQGTAIHQSGGAQIGGFLGYSFFPGTTGVLDLTFGGTTFSGDSGSSGTPGSFGARYTAYGLFGTGAYAAAGITRSSAGEANPSFSFGIPLGLTQTFRGNYQRSSQNSDSPTFASADWLLDRTDDPYFARHGLMLSAGPQWTKQRFVTDIISGRFNEFHLHSDQTIDRKGLSATAGNFRPLAQHSVLWSRVTVSRFDESGVYNGQSTPKVNETNGDFLIGLAHNFDSGTGGGDMFNRGRVELGAGYRFQSRDSTVHNFRDKGFEGNVGFAYRSEWGVIHLSMSYIAD